MRFRSKVTLVVSIAVVIFSCSKHDRSGTTDGLKHYSALFDTTGFSAYEGKYGIKSGIYTSKTTTNGSSLVTTTYFDDYGKKECEETILPDLEILGRTIKTSSAIFANGDGFLYHVDLERRTGVKTSFLGDRPPWKIDPRDISHISDITSRFSEEVGKMQEEAPITVLGRNCHVFSFSGGLRTGTLATWKGIMMRSETTLSGVETPIIMEVTKIEENVSIPADKFEVPKDVKIGN